MIGGAKIAITCKNSDDDDDDDGGDDDDVR